MDALVNWREGRFLWLKKKSTINADRAWCGAEFWHSASIFHSLEEVQCAPDRLHKTWEWLWIGLCYTRYSTSIHSNANSFPFSAYPHGAISLIVSLAKRWPQSLVVCSDTPAANSIGSTIANRICRAAFHTTNTTILRMDEQATLFHSPLDSPIGMVDGVAAGGLVGGAGARIVRFPFLPSAVC